MAERITFPSIEAARAIVGPQHADNSSLVRKETIRKVAFLVGKFMQRPSVNTLFAEGSPHEEYRKYFETSLAGRIVKYRKPLLDIKFAQEDEARDGEPNIVQKAIIFLDRDAFVRGRDQAIVSFAKYEVEEGIPFYNKRINPTTPSIEKATIEHRLKACSLAARKAGELIAQLDLETSNLLDIVDTNPDVQRILLEADRIAGEILNEDVDFNPLYGNGRRS